MAISAEKRTEDAQASIISLLKTEQARGIDLRELVAQVEIAIDLSGSMRPRFRRLRRRVGRGQEDGRDERRPADESLTTKLVLDAASCPVFWQFIGLGYEPDFMAKLDTMGNRVIDNVGLVEYADTLAMTDTEFFDAVIGEFFTQWLPEARRLGITRRGVLRCIEQQRILLSIRDSRSTFCSVAQAVRLTCGQTPGLWTNPRPDAADVLRFRS